MREEQDWERAHHTAHCPPSVQKQNRCCLFSLQHAAFVSPSHTRPDCACRLLECVLDYFVFVIVGRALEVLL